MTLPFENKLWQAADKLRTMVKRLLRRYGYPPDKQKMATELVLDQAKSFAEVWAV